ncbi:hypothetical protein BBP40_011225 [Aspergillus hancockii]|nr:hypothetical protein BBP40_011225 [Aspergillus hancockii]
MQVLWRETADVAAYESARLSRVFNARCPLRFPRAVVKPTNESDIIAAVKLAARHKYRIAVRSGGHPFPVWSVHENSILIDLESVKALEVDKENGIANVSPSVSSKELNDVLVKKYGMVFPGGHCPDPEAQDQV